MVKQPKFSKYDNVTFVAYITDFLALTNRINNETLNPHLVELTNHKIEMEKALNAERGNLLTEDIGNLDKERDKALAGIRKYVDSLTLYFDEKVVNAAVLLLRSIDKHGSNLTKLSYLKETRVIDSILEDWEKSAELSAAVEVLPLLGNWKANLAEHNKSFSDVYLNRVQSESAKDLTPLSKLIPDVKTTYNNLMILVGAFYQLDKVTFTPFVNDLNELITKYDTMVEMKG
jgi:hypothetical protein